MSWKPVTILSATVFLILAWGFGCHYYQSAHSAESSLAFLDQNLAQVDASVHQAKEQLAIREQVSASLREKLNRAQTALTAPKVVDPKDSLPAKDDATLLAADPKLRELYLKGIRSGLGFLYGSMYQMYQSLGLTQAQIDKFEELATAQADDVITMKAAALAQGLTLSDPAFAALEKQNLEQYYATIDREVGAPVSQKLIEYARLGPAESVAGRTANYIPLGSPPLTSLQVAQLKQIVANASASYQNGGDTNLDDINWDQANDLAAHLLSGAQLETYQAVAGYEQIQAKIRQFYAKPQASSP
jgi:hypothetical protein